MGALGPLREWRLPALRRGGRALGSPRNGRLNLAWTAGFRGRPVKARPRSAKGSYPAPWLRAAMPSTTRFLCSRRTHVGQEPKFAKASFGVGRNQFSRAQLNRKICRIAYQNESPYRTAPATHTSTETVSARIASVAVSGPQRSQKPAPRRTPNNAPQAARTFLAKGSGSGTG